MVRRGVRFAVGTLAIVAMLVPGLAARALPSPTADYPTWDEVQQAQANTAAAAAMVDSIGTLLDALQAESARLNNLAIEQGMAAAQAEADRDAAAATVAQLDTQADAAADRAEFSTGRAAQVVAAVVRAGGQDVTLALLANQDENLLQRLGMLERVGGQLDAVIQLAQFDRNTARALAAQAEDARAALAELAEAARTAADAATNAAAEADARVADQQAHLDELYEQLATLQGTSAEQERLYRIGQQATNEPGAGGGGDGGAGSGDGGGGSTDLGAIGNEVNNPAAAQAYAWEWFPHYGWDAGNQWCLTMLWNRESGWRTNAYNASSGAYGIPQSLPGDKMAAMGADWRTNFRTQITWGLVYIYGRYGNPCGAWSHSESYNWY